jgi:hypothetical protein
LSAVTGQLAGRGRVRRRLCLAADERVVAAAQGQQVGVAAVLDHPPVVHDQDQVGVDDRAEAVGDDDGCAVELGQVA